MIHRYSNARQVVRITRAPHGWFEVGWPLCIGGRVRSSGYGTGPLRDWRLDLQDLRWLRDEAAYEPPAWPERRPKTAAPKRPKVDYRQLALFDRIAA